MRSVEITTKAKKDIKRLKKQGVFDEKEFLTIVKILANDEEIPAKYLDHPLNGDYSD